jgi:23S rRNA (guanosine2251-2'-O)-methyltransferase
MNDENMAMSDEEAEGENSNIGNQVTPPVNRYLQDRKPTVDLIAGRQPVMEALRAGKMIEKVVLLFGVKGNAIEKIKMLAKQNRIPFVEVGKQRFRELVSDTTTQGVVALIGTKKYVEVEDILKLAKERNEPPFILILDEIEDPQNLGALIRSAECAGMHGVIIPKHHAVTVNQTVVKTSAGASEHMMVAKVVNVAQTIDELKAKKVWIVGTDSAAPKAYTDIDLNMPLAIVIGSEGAGIRRLVKEKCDFLVKIPLYGKIQSLNASVAGALVMFEAVRHRKHIGIAEAALVGVGESHNG